MYFSGFCLHGEAVLFEEIIGNIKLYDVCGFSYGAQKALDYAYERLKDHHRINHLILLSPAIFQDKTQDYKHLQVKLFKKNSKNYIQNFLDIAGITKDMNRYVCSGSAENLEELLNYVWSVEKLAWIQSRGVEIEVYLGGQDKIINPPHALEFFASYARVYFIKSANHFLKIHI